MVLAAKSILPFCVLLASGIQKSGRYKLDLDDARTPLGPIIRDH